MTRTHTRVGLGSGFAESAAMAATRAIGRNILRQRTSQFSTSMRTRAARSSRSAPTGFKTQQSFIQRLRGTFSRNFSSTRTRRNAQSPKMTSSPVAMPADNSLMGRIRTLSREYGWGAFGVYTGLSLLDFPFCLLLVNYLGTELIGEWEEVIVSHVKAIIPESVKSTWNEWRASMKQAEREMIGSQEVSDHVEMAGWGVEEAEKADKSNASWATKIALAYAIHKSFIFVRVPITVAVTPKVVKILRGWGWDIGKRTTKAAKAARRVEVAEKLAEKKGKSALRK